MVKREKIGRRKYPWRRKRKAGAATVLGIVSLAAFATAGLLILLAWFSANTEPGIPDGLLPFPGIETRTSADRAMLRDIPSSPLSLPGTAPPLPEILWPADFTAKIIARGGNLRWRDHLDGRWIPIADTSVAPIIPVRIAWESGLYEKPDLFRRYLAPSPSWNWIWLPTSRASINARRGQGPEAWAPDNPYMACIYGRRWIRALHHLGLAASKERKAALAMLLDQCP